MKKETETYKEKIFILFIVRCATGLPHLQSGIVLQCNNVITVVGPRSGRRETNETEICK